MTDRGFAARMRDLMRYVPDFSINEVRLLKLGRHFRLSPGAKAVIGRNEEENQKLLALSREEDILLEVVDFPGPLTVVRGSADHQQLLVSAGITARYSQARHLADVRVSAGSRDGKWKTDYQVPPASEPSLSALRIGNSGSP